MKTGLNPPIKVNSNINLVFMNSMKSIVSSCKYNK